MKAFLRPEKRSLQPDITPLLDIVFQLLLFFILSSVVLEPALHLDLPGSAADHKTAEADMIISMNSEGAIFLNDNPVQRDALESALAALIREKSDAAVLVRGDKGLHYGNFFEVVDAARNAGVKTIGLAYDEKTP
jgi:biopolymer transport protein ExbD